MKLPSDNKWTQFNQGNKTGVLHSTRNMDLETNGSLKLSKKAVAVVSESDDADFDTSLAINYFNNDYFVLTSDNVFRGALDSNTWTEVTGGGARTVNSDAIVFNGLYYVTVNADLSSYNGSTWSTGLEVLTAGVPHPMTIFDSLPTFKLAIGNGNVVETLDDSNGANSIQLTLPSNYEITTLAYKSGYLYVGTQDKNGNEGKIFIWDGATANANYEVSTGAVWVYSIIPYRSGCAAVTSAGTLLGILGSSSEILATFPIYNEPDKRWQDSVGPKIRHRGMVAEGAKIYLNVDGQLDLGFMSEMKSGIWCFEPGKGLNHRTGHSTDLLLEDASFSVANNLITTSAVHNLQTGDPVIFDAVSGLSGVDTDVVYYVDVQSTTTFYISKSRKSLKNGNYVTITGSVTSDQLVYAPNTDSGTLYQVTPGAIALTNPEESPAKHLDSSIVWGAQTEDINSNTISVLNVFSPSFNVGSAETQRIYAKSLTEAWNTIAEVFEGLDLSNEKIILKARTRYEEDSEIMQGVWAQTNVINTDATTNDEDAFDDIEVGDELTIVEGPYQGYSVHVIAIQDSSSVRELTVDESFGTVGSTIRFVRSNYKKITTFTNDRENHGYEKAALVDSEGDELQGTWFQFKTEVRGFDFDISHFDVSTASHKSNV